MNTILDRARSFFDGVRNYFFGKQDNEKKEFTDISKDEELTQTDDIRTKIFTDTNNNEYYLNQVAENNMTKRKYSELLLKMLQKLNPTDPQFNDSWPEGYEGRLVKKERYKNEGYRYFILENKEGCAIGILAGDVKKTETGHSFDLNNFYIKEEYANKGFGQASLFGVCSTIAKSGNLHLAIGLSSKSIDAGNEIKYDKMFYNNNMSATKEWHQNRGKTLTVVFNKGNDFQKIQYHLKNKYMIDLHL